VETLYIELKRLTVLMKVDMASLLGITITFTDNDGD
jgi:predicted lipoprotein